MEGQQQVEVRVPNQTLDARNALSILLDREPGLALGHVGDLRNRE